MFLYKIEDNGEQTMIGKVENLEIKNVTPTTSSYFYKPGKSSMFCTPKTSGIVMPKVKDVRFYDDKVTVVWFDDNEAPTRVVCKDGDSFSEEQGLAMAIAKKYYGSYERFKHSLAKSKKYKNKKRVKNVG